VDAAFHVLAERSPELVARHDASDRFQYVSEASLPLLGYEPQALIETSLLTLVGASERAQVKAWLAAVRAGQERDGASRTVSLVHRDGRCLTLLLTVYRVAAQAHDASGQLVSVLREASARELALARSEARLHTLMDAVPGMIYQWTARGDGRREFTFCNDWPRSALGLEVDHLGKLDVQLAELAHPDDVRTAWQLWERSAVTLEPWVWHGRFVQPSGQLLHVVGHATAQKQTDGTVLWSGVLLDDTPRRRMAAALSHSEELFSAVVANMEMAHFRLDLSGTLLLVNPAGVRILGYDDAQQLVGQSAETQLWLSPVRFQEVLEKAVREGVAAVEAPLRCRDGSLRVVQGALRLLRDQDGRGTAIDAVVRDVTDERKASEELILAREAAEAGSRAKSAFLANMSHEIRTPMNAIIGLSHLALEADPPAKQREYLTQIRTAGVALLDIINDILDVSKIEAGKVSLVLEPFELDRMLDSVANVIAVRAAERGLELVFAVDPRVPDELIGDRVRLGQVVMNLASNAVKFTECGEIVISVELLEKSTRAARLRFAVRDTGIGLSDEQRTRLFQPFSQVDSSTTRRYGGTGLGLAISQELVHLMNGSIEVDSKTGEGSEFRFELTFALPAVERPRPFPLPGARHMRVLVVDDSQVACDVLTRSLLALGFTVCAVHSAEVALESLREAEQRNDPFQLALLDVRMPETDGIELAQQITDGRTLRRPPEVVLISAYSRDELGRDRDLSRVRSFLRKPIGRATLRDTIARVFEKQPPQPQVAPSGAPTERKRPLTGLTLLVVEDNEINQVLARDLLEAAGAKVVLASDGPEALRCCAAQKPQFDVILMDVQMPGMDGHATTRALRLEAATAETPIVAMTAHAFDSERKKCLASGMNAHVAKPINPPELVKTVLAWARPEGSAPGPTPRLEDVPSQPARGAWSGAAGAPVEAERPSPGGPVGALARSTPFDASARIPVPAERPADTREGFDPSVLGTVFREPARQLAFLRKFVDSAQKTLRELDSAWERGAHDDISFVGHKLKSSAKACGAHSLATVCAELERHGKNADWRQLASLRGSAERLLDEVARHVARLEASP
jgi:two-component system, sensor histidine kinase and response regulator